MLRRKLERRVDEFFNTSRGALLITGARQVGKTCLIRHYGKAHFESFIEINFIESPGAKRLFENSAGASDILLRLSAYTAVPLMPGKTLIFFDEVQECPEAVTAIKFLVDEGSYRYILSGSLLGVELKDIRSVPVGYMDIFEMYPLDLEEFLVANGVSSRVIDALRLAFETKTPVDDVIHQKMMEMYKLYLTVGGMPAVVASYLENNDLRRAALIQRQILNLYRQDISKYDPENKLYLNEIFDLIPSELNAKNKRFILKNLNENFKFSRYEHSFIWLKEAGCALSVFCAEEPKSPLVLSRSRNLFKLFMADVGLLAAMYMDGIQLKLLLGQSNVNFGAIYENAAAQELKAHGYELYYFNSKKQGEIDFLIEDGGQAVPLEIKSGKDYERHAALNNVLSNPEYGIQTAYVFQNGNVRADGKTVYLPIYMLMFLQKQQAPETIIYRPDISVLKE